MLNGRHEFDAHGAIIHPAGVITKKKYYLKRGTQDYATEKTRIRVLER
jgi:hypothetical protein